MKKLYLRKRVFTCMAAAILAASAGFAGSSLSAQAASYIKDDNSIIRDAANGKMIGGISKGTEVDIVESKTGTDGKIWHHVRYAANGTTAEGWVRSDLITSTDGDTDQTQTPTEGTDGDTDTTPAGADQSADVTGISGDGYKASGDNAFDVQGKTLTIAGKIDASKIPAHFKAATITYNGKDIKACKYEYGDVYLVYLTAEDGSGDFYVLDTQKNIVTSYISVGTGDNPLVLLVPPENASISDSYGKTVLAVSETAGITAYQYNQPKDTLKSDTILGEYYYVYGMTQDGTAGWYLYDNAGNSFVRATSDLSVELDKEEKTQEAPTEDNSLDKMIIVGLGILCVIFFVLMLMFAGKSRSARKYLPEETFDEDDEEEIMTRAEKRKEDRKYRHFMDEEPEQKKVSGKTADKKAPEPQEISYDGGEVYLDEDEDGPASTMETDFREDTVPLKTQTTDNVRSKPAAAVTDFCEIEETPESVERYEDFDEMPESVAPEMIVEDEVASADKEELKDLEKMLMAGLEDALKDQDDADQEELSISDQEVRAVHKEHKTQKKSAKAPQSGKNHVKKNGKDGWDDELEFLDL